MNKQEQALKPTEQQALALYRPPFRFECGYLYDADNRMVADQHETSICRVRGWGRIGYMENPEALQDAVGEHIAKALTAYWTALQPTEQPENERERFEAWANEIDSKGFDRYWAWQAWQAAKRDAAQAPQGFDAEFLSKRLARVAKLVGYPMPNMTHEQIAEAAGTILGAIAGIMERSAQAPQERNEAGETPTEHAHRWATELATSMGRKFYPEVLQWEPLPDLLGVITQIDNMVTGLVRAPQERAAVTDAEIDDIANSIVTADPVKWWRELARKVISLAQSKEVK